jgi:hypothetical protein
VPRDRRSELKTSLTFGRRQDVWTRLPADGTTTPTCRVRTVHIATEGGLRRQVSSRIVYPTGHQEGWLTFRFDEKLPRLSPLNRFVFLVACTMYADGRADADGKVHSSRREFSRVMFGYDNTHAIRMVDRAFEQLVDVVIEAGSEHLAVAETPGRQGMRRTVERGRLRQLYHLVEEVALFDSERLDARGRWIDFRLGSPVVDAIDHGGVATIPLQTLQRLTLRHEVASTLACLAYSKRDTDGTAVLAADTLEQILRPPASWSLHGPHPANFRQKIDKAAATLAEADGSLECRIEDATPRSGGWKLVIRWHK